MTDLLTDSFCERCGTRFTLGEPPKSPRLSKIKVLSRGLKSYVMSDQASLNDALGEARGETQRQAVSRQLETFQQTFNFCLTCREYLCSNCWNEDAGRCVTCAAEPSTSAEAVSELPTVVEAEPPTDPVVELRERFSWPEVAVLPPKPAPAPQPIRVAPDDPWRDLSVPWSAAESEPAADSRELVMGTAESFVSEPVAEPAAEPVVATEPIVATDFAPTIAADAPPAPALPIDPWRGVKWSAEEEAAQEAAHPEPAVEPAQHVAIESASQPDIDPWLAAELEAAITFEPVAAESVAAAAEPEIAAAPEPEPEVVAEPEPEPALEAVVVAEPAPEPEPEVVAESAPEPDWWAWPRPVDTANTDVAVVADDAEPEATPATATEPDPKPIAAEAAPAIIEPDVIETPRRRGLLGRLGAGRQQQERRADPDDVPLELRLRDELFAADQAAQAPAQTDQAPHALDAPEPAVPATSPTPESAQHAPAAEVWWIVAPEGAPSLDDIRQPTWNTRPAASTAPSEPTPTPAQSVVTPLGRTELPAMFSTPVNVNQAPNVWAASSRNVVNRPGSGVQACQNCALPLSATARFCRRCGSAQG